MENFCWGSLELGTLQGFAIAIFAFTSHTSIFMVQTELVNPIQRRLKKIFKRAILGEMVLYALTSYAGYLSMLNQTPPLIINRPALPGSKDYLMLVGRLGVFLQVCVCSTINQAPCRAQIFTFLGVDRKIKTWEHTLATLLIVGSATGIAIIFPNIISAFGFVGGIGAVFIAIIFPIAIYVKQSKFKWYSWGNLFFIILCIVCSAAGFASAVLSILDAAKVIDINKYSCIPANNTKTASASFHFQSLF